MSEEGTCGLDSPFLFYVNEKVSSFVMELSFYQNVLLKSLILENNNIVLTVFATCTNKLKIQFYTIQRHKPSLLHNRLVINHP